MFFQEGHNEEQDLVQSASDEELLKRSLKNPRLFEILLARYEEAFLRKAYYILGTKEAAEDAVQDAFVKIYKNAGRFEPQRPSWGALLLVTSLGRAREVTRLRGGTRYNPIEHTRLIHYQYR